MDPRAAMPSSAYRAERTALRTIARQLDSQMRAHIRLADHATGVFGASLVVIVLCSVVAVTAPRLPVLAGAFAASLCFMLAMGFAGGVMERHAVLPGVLPSDIWDDLLVMEPDAFADTLHKKLGGFLSVNDHSIRIMCRRLAWAYWFAFMALPVGALSGFAVMFIRG